MHPELLLFLELCSEVSVRVKTIITERECEPQFTRVLDHVQAHPEHRVFYIEAFRMIILERHRSITDELVCFCMRSLRWPEVVEFVRERMSQDVHNSEYESLRELQRVYESNAA